MAGFRRKAGAAAPAPKGKDTTPAASTEANASVDVIGNNGRARLISFVERIERLAEEAKVTADDLRETYSEAKGEGYDVKILRVLIRRRAQDPAKRQEMEAVLDLYESALNGPDTPFEREAQPGDTVTEEEE